MPLDDDACYLALKARDARFDGRLFVGVTSTGIYCRPVCRVRTPLRRNCRFFGGAAGAEQAGFRPCLRCRPELAPGLSLVDSPQVLALQAARWLEQAVRDGDEVYLGEVAARLGVTDRHLRRIFHDVHGVTPMAFVTTQRLLLAKQLLTDTELPVTQVALGCGFGSLRRFHAAFAQHYRLTPGALRRSPRGPAPAGTPPSAGVVVRLAYRPPYDVAGVLAFFRARQVPGIEAVDGLTVRRTLAWTHRGQRITGWLAGRFVPERHEVELQVAPTLLPALGSVLQRVRQGLDMEADPALIDPVMALPPAGTSRTAWPAPAPGLRVPGAMDGFEVAVRIILGQQVTVAAARTLTRRLVDALGEPIATPWPDLDRLFPGADTLASASADDIGRLGIVRQRVAALKALATAVRDGHIVLHRGAPLQPTLDALRALPGVGEWTTQLIALRALSWPDAWPGTDIGLLSALGTRDPKAAEAAAQAWRPWRSYAVMRLWQTLETTT